MNTSNKQVVALIKVALLTGVMLVAVEMYLIPASCIGQSKAQAGVPVPRIDYISLDRSPTNSVTITQGESVIVQVQVTNVGTASGDRGAIYISFPGFGSYGDATYVELWDYSADMVYHEYRSGDSSDPIRYHCGSGYSGAAQALLVVAEHNASWEAGETIYVGVKVRFPRPGTYPIYVRTSVSDSEGSYHFDPSSERYEDQQCRYAYRQTVEVEAGPGVVYLPVVLEHRAAQPLRGVRVQASGCYKPSRCDSRLRCFEAARVNVVYYTIYWNDPPDQPSCRYHSNLMPHRDFDALEYLIPRAHARGIQVYALMPSGNMGWPEHPRWNARLNYPEATEDWLDFALPEARSFLADVAEEIVTNYDVDGILLDATRWREQWYRQADLSAEDVSLAVRGIYDRVKAVRPEVLVAASPHADPRFSLNERGQDWLGWLGGGYIDYVTPMIYENDYWVRRYLNQWMEFEYFPERIVPRLSVCTFNPTTPKSVGDVLGQIEICYSKKTTGVTLWDDRYVCTNPDLIESLGAGGW